jgi:hypothetical protein
VYAKSYSYRESGDVAQGRSYICGMTVADPLENRDQGKASNCPVATRVENGSGTSVFAVGRTLHP